MSLRYTTFHRVLHRPNLFLGCDRELVLIMLLLCIALIATSGNVFAMLFGCSVIFIGLPTLRKMALADPGMRKIYLRQLKYLGFYPARSRAFRIDQK